MKPLLLAFAVLLPLSQAHASPAPLTSAKATSLATEAVAIAAKQGYRVSATVVDADGAILATVRGDGASATTPKTTFKKAFTAIATQQHTSDFLANVHKNDPKYLNDFVLSTLRERQDHIVLLGGGVLIKQDDTIIGAIGVGGAPGGHIDDAIANDAMEAVGI